MADFLYRFFFPVHFYVREKGLNARKIQCKAHTFCLAYSAFKSTKDEKTDLHLHTQFICHDLWLKLCITHFYHISFYIISYMKMYSQISSLVFLELGLTINNLFLKCFWNFNKISYLRPAEKY